MRYSFIISWIIFLIISCFLFSCEKSKKEPALFDLQKNTGINFSNDIQYTKELNIFNYRNFFNGGGVAIGDINNDGLADIFFTANMGSNKLYLNKGKWQFTDISEKAGFINKTEWSTGVVMVDVNSDGWLDVYVCNAGYIQGAVPENKLYINNRNLTFTESAKEYGLTNRGGYATHAAFFDFDLDGDLDCFIINNSFIPVNTLNYANKRSLRAQDWPVADFLKGGGDHFLRNDNGKFVDISKESGIYGSLISFGLGVTVGDVNGDHYPDVYVSNDFFERDYLYINQKNGSFKDECEKCLAHTSLSSMGADMGDINNDGFPDLFVTDMLPDDDYRLKTTTSFESIDVYKIKEKSGFYHQFQQNTLQLNNKNGKFTEIAYYSGVAASDWSWGGLLFDADNDGFNDIYVCNGISRDLTDQDFIDFFANDVVQKMMVTGKKGEDEDVINKMPSRPLLNKAFKNMGNLKFSDSGVSWGFTQPSFSNGAAYGDLDNDGDLDLVVNNVNQKAFIYHNNSRESGENNYVGLSLKGKDKNTFAIGTTINVYVDDQILSRQLVPSRGFQSSVDYKVIIGLGKRSQADSIVIIWPDSSFTTYINPVINKVHFLQQTDYSEKRINRQQSNTGKLLLPLKSIFDKHQEDDYIDFYNERNIPRMLSREGPKAACGDVNGDGMEDIYIGGASGQHGQLYLQTSTGFIKKSMPSLQQIVNIEEVAVLFFDKDMDGDLDLYVGTGGNNMPANSLEMQDIIFENDGKGNFGVASDVLPHNGMNTAVAIANDFDGDGDPDLFVGSRSVPMNYGITPKSYLYQNNGKGVFTDIAQVQNPEIANIGMVTGAVWVDITGGNQKELIIVGEWMSPRVFAFNNGHFEEVKTNLSELYGWWKAINSGDLDGDGDEDLVLGNIGENFYLRPNKENPVKLWINDFDQNSSREKILTRSVAGKDMPVFLKREVVDQIPSLKKQSLKYHEYAKRSIHELFTPQLLRNSIVKNFNYASSCIALNEGNGKFTIQRLPMMVQSSSVNTAFCGDVNGDGYADLVLGGNDFGFLPQFGRLDASFGHVLLNDGKAGFNWLGSEQSGLELRGEIMDVIKYQGKTAGYMLFLQNDQYPALYEIQKAYAGKNKSRGK